MQDKVAIMDNRMNEIRVYMSRIEENKKELEQKKSLGLACLNTKMKEIRQVRELQVLKHLKETIVQIRDRNYRVGHQDHSLLLRKLRNISDTNNENIQKINQCIMEDEVQQ